MISLWGTWVREQIWSAVESYGWSSLWHLMLALFPVWAIGAITGYLLPRPKNEGQNPNALLSTLFVSGTAWRRAALAWHGAVILREVWYHWTCPGTFRRFSKAVANWCLGRGWHFDFPTAQEVGLSAGTPCAEHDGSDSDSWYVSRKDLEFFQQRALQDKPVPGASSWEVMMEKEVPNAIKYVSWRRTLPSGKTEYKSETYSADATAQEFIDLYFDDDFRPNWDAMIILHEVLEHGDFSQREQVVRWIRRFPFSFISDREYVLARRLFRDDESLYGITKAVPHPRAPQGNNVVKMDVFYSMWNAKTVPCPWGSAAPACKTVLLHHEQFKIPENLARFAVKHGMWPFIKKLMAETPNFTHMRRQRCDPHKEDKRAFGAGCAPNPPTDQQPHEQGSYRRTDTAASGDGSLLMQSDLVNADSVRGLGKGSQAQLKRSNSAVRKSAAALALAGGFAVALRRSPSVQQLHKSRSESSSLRALANERNLHRKRSLITEGGSDVRLGDLEAAAARK